VAAADRVKAAIAEISSADNWNRRVTLIRQIPERFGTAQHQDIFSAIAEAVYVAQLAPDFAYIHWRDDYELQRIETAYADAHALTDGFATISVEDLARTIKAQPPTLRIFRLLLGFTTQEFAESTAIPAAASGAKPLSNGSIKAIENGRPCKEGAAVMAAAVIDQAMRGVLFADAGGDVRSKINKPDTVAGWATVQKFAATGVPFPVFLHQRHYGGAFRQLLDATSTQRGDILEDAVEELFTNRGVQFVRTGAHNQAEVAARFGITIRPAPDFVVHDEDDTVRAILECKQANDGGTARDKAARFRALRAEAMRLGGIPVIAVLAGLGWRRTADALGPVVQATDGRVFTIQSLDAMLTVEPFPGLLTWKPVRARPKPRRPEDGPRRGGRPPKAR
jgi:hypothetical protein